MTLCELDRLRNLVIRSEIKRTDIIEEMVFKSYLKHENLKDTAKEINELNFRDNNGKLIRTSQQEVSDINNNPARQAELVEYLDGLFKSDNILNGDFNG